MTRSWRGGRRTRPSSRRGSRFRRRRGGTNNRRRPGAGAGGAAGRARRWPRQAQLAALRGAAAREGAIERLAVQVKNDYAQSVADAQAKKASADAALAGGR